MNPTPIEEARRALELATNAVLDASRSEIKQTQISGVSLLEAIHRFVRMVGANVHLDRARVDSQGEYDRERSVLLTRKVQLVTDLCALRQEAQAAFPVLAESATSSASPSLEKLYSLARFDVLAQNALEERGEIDEEDISDPNAGSADVADVLWTVLEEWLPKHGVDPTDKARAALLKRLRPMCDELNRLLSSSVLSEGVVRGWEHGL